MDIDLLRDAVKQVRRFNRFYTDVIGVLNEGIGDTKYSLTDARILFELSERERTESSELRRSLNIDPGYLSRTLTRLEGEGLIERSRSPDDARRQVLALTEAGKEVYAMLDARSSDQVRGMLGRLAEEDRRRLLGAMGAITDTLSPGPEGRSVVLRPLRPGDIGWVVHRHGVVYNAEYRFDSRFESLVARIVADYVDNHDPSREHAWIAEVDGQNAGSIFCCKKTDEVAQLRLLLVEPSARGLGVGQRLVDECVRFAAAAGYESMMLWTNDILHAARKIYERAGFMLEREEPHHSYGVQLNGQYWTRSLR